MQPDEIQEKLGLNVGTLAKRKWHVQPSCAASGDGLLDGLNWLIENHKK